MNASNRFTWPMLALALAAGLVDLRVIQASAFIVLLGLPTLTIEHQHVPSLGTASLAGLALVMAGWVLRRRGSGPSVARAPGPQQLPRNGRLAWPTDGVVS